MLGWIVFGLIVGVLARILTPGRDPGGWVVTMALGMAGAAIGGWIGRSIGLYGPDQPAGLFMALVGAILLLLAYRMAVGRKTA